jgi:hypothetical protein
MFIGPIITFGTFWDSRTPEDITPDSGVGVGVDFFLGVGSGSGLPQMLNVIPDFCPWSSGPMIAVRGGRGLIILLKLVGATEANRRFYEHLYTQR